jgi:hypothetical protein
MLAMFACGEAYQRPCPGVPFPGRPRLQPDKGSHPIVLHIIFAFLHFQIVPLAAFCVRMCAR